MRLIQRLWNKMNEPEIERALIVLLPFVTIVFAAVLILPNALALLDLGDGPEAAIASPEAAAQEDEDYAHVQELPIDTPLPETEPPDLGYYGQNGYRGVKNIGGKYYFFDSSGIAAKSLGIDVSSYNYFIDWGMVALQGIDFAIIRIGARGWESGDIYPDGWAQQNLSMAKAAGLRLGVYFYSTALSVYEAREEAQYVLECLGGMDLDLPVYIDLEYSGDYPEGRADLLSRSQRAMIVEAFCDTVKAQGYEAGLYTGLYYLQHELPREVTERYSLWIANYTYGGRRPSYQGDYDIWQFTENGRLAGILGPVDLNAVF